MRRIKGKNVLVVGGSGGIGLETVKMLEKRGDTVTATYLKRRPDVKKPLRMDVTDAASVEAAVSGLNGEIDAVVYAVSGPVDNRRIGDLEWKDYSGHMEVQVRGFLNVVKAVTKNVQGNVRFVVILTEYCIGKPPSLLSHYVAAKYALMGLVKSLSSEMDARKYTFNMVSPGMTNTPLLEKLPEKLIELTVYNNPMKRIASPADVAGVIVFLLSDGAGYLNGVNIPVNGGGKLL